MYNVLVTGARRSGTTFAGQMLSMDKSISYIHEPFNPEQGINGLTDRWYAYLSEQNISSKQKDILDNLFKLNALEFKLSLGDAKTDKFNYNAKKLEIFKNIFTNSYNEKITYRIGRYFVKNSNNLSYVKAIMNPFSKRILIKDPLAALSSRYLVKKFNLKVVVVIRHPAAFYFSMKKQKWGVDCKDFINQRMLIKDYLSDLEKELLEARTQGERAIMEWICVNKVLNDFCKNDPDNFIITRHEDLSLHPIKSFRDLYHCLEIPFGRNVEQGIVRYTNHKNKNFSKRIDDCRRNSLELVSSWKTNLSQGEIDHIKKKTWFLAKEYYPDEWW